MHQDEGGPCLFENLLSTWCRPQFLSVGVHETNWSNNARDLVSCQHQPHKSSVTLKILRMAYSSQRLEEALFKRETLWLFAAEPPDGGLA